MPLEVTKDSDQVLKAIESGKPTVVHWWAPWMGPESPFRPLLEEYANRSSPVAFYIVDSGFVHSKHSRDEMPLTVFYIGGNEIDSAPFVRNATEDLLKKV